MLPENFATPPDNRGPGQHLPPVPTSAPPVRGAVYICWTWGPTCQDPQLSADRRQNARNREGGCGFGRPWDVGGRLATRTSPGAVRRTEWGSEPRNEALTQNCSSQNKTENPTTKQTRAENQVKETPPECPWREEMIELEEHGILHRS